ncbi:hypothetical protein BH20ACI4_BH20ACI4_20210 [soil metagenome]
MKKIKFFCFVGFVLFSIFVFTANAQTSIEPASIENQTEINNQSEIEEWIRAAGTDTQNGAIFNYSYFLKVAYKKNRKLGFGRKFTRLYEAIIPSRFNLKKLYTHPLVLIEDSERQVLPDEIRNAREDLILNLERAENTADDAAEKQQQQDGGYWTIHLKANELRAKVDVFKMLEISKFSNIQYRQLNGREIISIDFAPQATVIFDTSLSYMSKIEGQLWIDKESKRIIRMEGFPVGTFSSMREKNDEIREQEAVFFFKQIRVVEGFWFPEIVRLDFTRNPQIFDNVRLEFIFSDYRKSSVEIWKADLENLKTETEKEPVDDNLKQNNPPKVVTKP